ncbi:MAG: hypothetical protein OEY56_08625, partial [Cyclobacteriaceae bacterium]|nr:hypothetical protein [Cyclobacteriaceae bacterium]
VVRRTLFEQNARNFVTTEFNLEEAQVISQRYALVDNKGIIEVTLYGKQVGEEKIREIEGRLPQYKLMDVKLKVRQGYQEDVNATARLEFEKMSQSLRVGVLEDLYARNEEILKSREDHIALLENEIKKLERRNYPIDEITAELRVQYNSLASLSLGDLINQDQDTICHAVLHFTRPLRRSDVSKIEEWLVLRTKADTLIVLIR